MAAEIDEVSEAIATESEEIAMSGLKRSRESAESREKDAAKDFQAWTGGARNLVNIARACRGLDARNGNGDAAASITNIFAVGSLSFGAKPDAAPAHAHASEPRNVTPQNATCAPAPAPLPAIDSPPAPA
jgi:hypothetical protein